MIKMKLLRKTYSKCNECYQDIYANVIEEDKKIYLIKKCLKHGMSKDLISDDSVSYKKLLKIYINFNDKIIKKENVYYNLFLTSKCDLNCEGCKTKNVIGKEPTIEFIKKWVSKIKNIKIGLWGGEVTERKDLSKIIRIIANSGNIPAIYTNGIKLANLGYLKKLKKSGLKIVHIEFEGFDERFYKGFNYSNILQRKVIALNNLEKLGIATAIQSTIIQNKNEKEMSKILNYSVSRNFIKSIFFKSHKYTCKKEKEEERTSTERLLELLEEQTNGKLSKGAIIKFQKNILSLCKIMSIKRCFYNKAYFIFRNKNGFRTIDDVIRLKRISFRDYFNLINLSFMAILRKLFNEKIISSDIPKDIIYVSFGRQCDKHNFDRGLTENCELDVVSMYGIKDTLADGNILFEKNIDFNLNHVH